MSWEIDLPACPGVGLDGLVEEEVRMVESDDHEAVVQDQEHADSWGTGGFWKETHFSEESLVVYLDDCLFFEKVIDYQLTLLPDDEEGPSQLDLLDDLVPSQLHRLLDR